MAVMVRDQQETGEEPPVMGRDRWDKDQRDQDKQDQDQQDQDLRDKDQPAAVQEEELREDVPPRRKERLSFLLLKSW